MVRMLLLSLVFTTIGYAQEDVEAIEKVTVTVDPVEATTGSLVNIQVKLELKSGWYTYPVYQPDRGAKQMTNKFKLNHGAVLFVGKVQDPAAAKSKAEPELGIDKLLYHPEGGTWSIPAIVSPNAPTGEIKVPFSFSVQICNETTCLPPKKLDLIARIQVKPGQGIDPKYKDEVEKILKETNK